MTNEQSRREQIFEQRMTDFEALMWNIEKDPWLNPNGCSLTVLDGPVDLENFRSHVTWAVEVVPDDLLALFLPVYEGSVVELKKQLES